MTPLTTVSKKLEVDVERLKKRELFQSLKEQIKLKEYRKRLEKKQEEQEEKRLLREQEDYQYFGKGGAGGVKKDYYGRVIASKNPDPSIVSKFINRLYGRETYNRQMIYNEPQQELNENEAAILARYHNIHIKPEEQTIDILNRNIIKGEKDFQERASRRRSRGNTKDERLLKEKLVVNCTRNEERSVRSNLSTRKNFSRDKSHAEYIPIRNATTKDKLKISSASKESHKETREQLLTRSKDKVVEEARSSKKRVVSEVVIRSRKLAREGKAHKANVTEEDNDQVENAIFSTKSVKEELPKQVNESHSSIEEQSKNEESIQEERERLRPLLMQNEYIEKQRRFERTKAREMLPLAKNIVHQILNIDLQPQKVYKEINKQD
jgi:hypothetical protein